jgi:hypothetical protein
VEGFLLVVVGRCGARQVHRTEATAVTSQKSNGLHHTPEPQPPPAFGLFVHLAAASSCRLGGLLWR